MRKAINVMLGLMLVGSFGLADVWAQGQACPPELAKAQAALKSLDVSALPKSAAQKPVQAPRVAVGARTQDVQAPRGQDVQAPRGQDVQAPRGQDVQAPRGQDVQAPRGQDVQAPRGQDVQAPRGQDVQAPRGQDVQAPRGQDVQAPRGQDIQAPRGQDVQAPRGQDVQAPRGQDIQAPRGQDIQAPRAPAGAKSTKVDAQEVAKAQNLIRESEQACQKGDLKLSAQKAKEALEILE